MTLVRWWNLHLPLGVNEVFMNLAWHKANAERAEKWLEAQCLKLGISMDDLRLLSQQKYKY